MQYLQFGLLPCGRDNASLRVDMCGLHERCGRSPLRHQRAIVSTAQRCFIRLELVQHLAWLYFAHQRTWPFIASLSRLCIQVPLAH